MGRGLTMVRRKVPNNFFGRWYEGEFVPTENQPKGTSLRILYYKRHWTANVAHVMVKFYLTNWQWLIGTLIGVVSVWVAVLALK